MNTHLIFEEEGNAYQKSNKIEKISDLMENKLTGQDRIYQFCSGLHYLLINDCHSIAFEAENFEDAVFYFAYENNENPIKIAEAKFRSNQTWTLRSLFFTGRNPPIKGPFLKLWERWVKRKVEGKKCINLVFFTTGKLTKSLLQGKEYKIPTKTEFNEMLIEVKQLFPDFKNEKELTPEIFYNCFATNDIFFSQTIENLKKEISDHIKHKNSDPNNLEKFFVYLQSEYKAGRKITKKEFFVWMQKRDNSIQNIYATNLNSFIEKAINQSKIKLVENRTCTTLNQNEENQMEFLKKYSIKQILNIHSNFDSRNKIITITGEMGMGKTTFMYQMLKEYLESHKDGNLPLFAELTQWDFNPKNNAQIFKQFASFLVANLQQKLKDGIYKDDFIAKHRDLCSEIETILYDTPTYIFLDAFDEFIGNKEKFLSLMDQLRAKGHRIFLSGRIEAIRTLEKNEEGYKRRKEIEKEKYTKNDFTRRNQIANL